MSDIAFVKVDAQEINSELVNNFETALGETLYPGDERRIFLEQETQVIVGLKNDINETAKQNLLRYATGEILDAWGERVNTPRLEAQVAIVNCRITLSEAQSTDIIIEKGKRVTPDGVLFFGLKNTITIPAGQISMDTVYESTEAGEKYNGFTAGQIKTMVDPISYVANIINLDTSGGGSDIEPDDDGVNVWSGYRERIRQAPAKFSTAGHEDGYIALAKSADANILDAKPTSPSEGTVKINVLMKGGEMPTQTILDKVLAICSAKKSRPLTDHVIASAPTVLNYNINLTYYIAMERSASEVSIREAIEGGVIDEFNTWQSGKLGRSINPDYLRQLMLNAGAFRIELSSPSFTAVTDDKVAKVGTITVNYGGVI
jgi:phage-related baseplate assembly protein